jgi:endonuclease/exonuclease/phosphatase (EEP) superfamily protein YafD
MNAADASGDAAHPILDALCRWAILGVAVAAAASVTMYLPPLHWALDLATHFPGFYLGVAALALIALLWGKRRGWAAVALAVMVLNGAAIVPWYLPVAGAVDQGTPLRVMLANVLTSNTNHEAFVDFVRREDPDILVIEEVSTAWRASLAVLEDTYVDTFSLPREDNFGIALFSKYVLDGEHVYLARDNHPNSIVATAYVGDQNVYVLATHPLPPVGSDYASKRNEQLALMGELIGKRTGPVLVVGDLNTTMWSPHYKRFVRDSGLRNARRGYGVLGSWPTEAAPLTIPLDHCLYKGPLHVTSCRLGPDIGSDHLPVVVDFVLAPSARMAKSP